MKKKIRGLKKMRMNKVKMRMKKIRVMKKMRMKKVKMRMKKIRVMKKMRMKKVKMRMKKIRVMKKMKCLVTFQRSWIRSQLFFFLFKTLVCIRRTLE